MIKSFFKLVSFLPTNSRLRLILIVFLLFICALLEVLGISAILPFLAILLDENFIDNAPNIIQNIILILNITSRQQLIIYSLCVIILIYIVKAIITALSYWIQYNFMTNLELDMRFSLFKKYISSHYSFFLNTSTPEILRNLAAVTPVIDSFLKQSLIIVAELFVVFALSFMLLYNEFLGGLFLITFFTIAIFLFQFFTKKKLKYWGEKLLLLQPLATKINHQSIHGIKVVKMFGKEKFFLLKTFILCIKK